jgi:DNA polymerase III alpha subunit
LPSNSHLKANYPAEYMAAVVLNMSDIKQVSFMEECKRMGLQVFEI